MPKEDPLKGGEDPKGWDRASIMMKTHPLHPMPRVTPADLLLPSTVNKLKFVADCLACGAAVALLSYFPLLLASFMTTDNLSAWIVGTMVTVGVGSTILVFVAGLAAEREFERELQELL